MKAVQITGFGGPEVVKVQDAPEPVAAPGTVVVRVAAAGVNPVDIKIRDGYMKDFMPWTFPATLGNEIAGIVEAVGEGVEGFAPGDEVIASTGARGAFAGLVAIDAAVLAKKPAALDMVHAAALPVAVATSMPVIEAGEIGKGTRVLVHAAAGGVGNIFVQLVRARGAEVTALGSPDNLDFLRDIGADHVVDRTTDYASGIGGFDVVLDAFGPPAQEKSWALLKPGGILVSLVAPPSQETAEAHGVRAVMTFGRPDGPALIEAAKLVDAGKLKVTVQRTYPAEQVNDAFAEVEGGKVRGKVVLTF
jgi:NADPH:quinone reductase-like Zn-dependent oxidoreductase